MDDEVIERVAGENADRLLHLIVEGRPEGLRDWMRGRTPDEVAWMALALASGFLDVEAERDRLLVANAVLQRQNETLDTANGVLFRERRRLLDKVAELREINNVRAAKAPTRKKEAA